VTQLGLALGAEVGLPVEALGIRGRVQHHRRAGPARQQVEQPLIDAGNAGGERTAHEGGGQGLGHHAAAGGFAHPAVGHHEAGRVEQPCLGVGRGLDQAAQQRAGLLGQQGGAVVLHAHGRLGDGAGVDAGLGAHRFHLGGEQPVLVLVEIEQGGGQQGGRQRVDQQDSTQQGRDPAPAGRRGIGLGLEERRFGHQAPRAGPAAPRCLAPSSPCIWRIQRA
jgi:hypothetical protein